MILIHQRHRQTCDRNTALCTKVHRAVKSEFASLDLLMFNDHCFDKLNRIWTHRGAPEVHVYCNFSSTVAIGPIVRPTLTVCNFYRAMHFSAKRGIAIACRLSVCLSVRDVGDSGAHRLEISETNCSYFIYLYRSIISEWTHARTVWAVRDRPALS